jgi:hypothetical protein
VDEPDRFAEFLLAPEPAPSLPATASPPPADPVTADQHTTRQPTADPTAPTRAAANGAVPAASPPAAQFVPDPLTDPLPTLLERPAPPELPPAPELPNAPVEEYGTALPATAARPAEPEIEGYAGLAVLARQVEAARRHLQAAVVVAHDQSHSAVGDLLGVVEQVLGSLTELATGAREALPASIAGQVLPGEARFLCSMPWERNPVVADDPHGPEPAGSSGLCRLLLALGYEAQLVTGSAGASSVQIRTDRYAAHIALVEPAGGGRQRWSGALEWYDGNGATRTWAETLGPVELDEEELARRTDELLRRCVGPLP